MTTDAVSAPVIRRASAADAALLAVFARDAFVETFGADTTPEDMARYVAGAFGEPIQRREIEDAANTVFLAERDGAIAGYVMLREGAAPEAVGAANAIEISRLYSATRFIGSGIGASLMRRAIDEAVVRGRDVIWLGVWERNARAIAFYERWGFRDVGTQSFQLGDDLQTDRILMRQVP